MSDFSWRFLQLAAQFDVRRNLEMTVEGLDNLPSTGPVLIVARHYHHLHDGAALLALTKRPTRILVGLDWIENPALRWIMERLCAFANWPVVHRRRQDKAIQISNARTLIAALNQSEAILRRDEMLIVFPEGFPTIDPVWTPKTTDDEILPFLPGFLKIARRAQRAGINLRIVPVGLEYQQGEKWELKVRFGEPVLLRADDKNDEILAMIERKVRFLSGM